TRSGPPRLLSVSVEDASSLSSYVSLSSLRHSESRSDCRETNRGHELHDRIFSFLRVPHLLQRKVYQLNRNTGDWHRGALADRSMVARPIAQSSRSCCAESDDSKYSSG